MSTALSARVLRWSDQGAFQWIELEAADGFAFRAGQYVCLVHPDGESIPFSVASAPHELPGLRILYQPTAGHPHSRKMTELRASAQLELTGPHGEVRIEAPPMHCVLVAEGSGIGQSLCILEHLLHQAGPHRVEVVWGCAPADAGAIGAALQSRAREDARLSFRLCARDAHAASGAALSGETGSEHPEFILTGSPEFVHGVARAALAAGVHRERLHSDVFAWQPLDQPGFSPAGQGVDCAAANATARAAGCGAAPQPASSSARS